MNSSDPVNPAEQVERIREILIGRDIELVNERIQQVESRVQHQSDDVARGVSAQLHKATEQYNASQESVKSMTAHIRQQLQQETVTRGQQINDLATKIDAAATRMNQTSQQLLSTDTGRDQNLNKKLDNLSSEMGSRIDAHSRQIMEHMHREIQQWKNRMDGQMASLADDKVDRQELSTRLARIASAAMGDAVPPHGPPTQDAPPNFSSLDVFAMPTDPTDDFTS